jgi:hypothetical protein
LIYFFTIGLQIALGPLVGLLSLFALPLALIGLVRLSTGMGYSWFAKVLLVILMFVPLVNLITLLILNSRASTRLRAAGYHVGLMGASKPDVA